MSPATPWVKKKSPRSTTGVHRGTQAPTTNYRLQEGASNASVEIARSFSFDDMDLNDSMYNRRQLYFSPSLRQRLEETQNDPELSDHDKIIIQRLAMRSFHLPGNSFWEDWNAFLFNNHPVFSLTGLSDPRHPFGRRERIINLVASLAFGLAATSCVILWYYYQERDMNQIIMTIGGFEITHGLIALLFFGGMLHVVFDFGLWFLQACPCCREGGFCVPYLTEQVVNVWLWLGRHLALEVTVISLILCVGVIVLRASLNNEEEGEDASDDQLARIQATGIDDYAFLFSYAMEVVVSLFVLFPIVAFTIFSGVLGCGRLPGIGGRPWQKSRWKLRQERLAQRQNSQEGVSLNRRRSGMASV